MKPRFSPKYFYIRTGVMSFTIATLILVPSNYWFITEYVKHKAELNDDRFWAMLIMLGLTFLLSLLTYIAWKSYQDTFMKGDKIMWQTSKWKVIKRWLLEPYR